MEIPPQVILVRAREREEAVEESSEDTLGAVGINAGKSIDIKRHSDGSYRWEGMEGFGVPGQHPGSVQLGPQVHLQDEGRIIQKASNSKFIMDESLLRNRLLLCP